MKNPTNSKETPAIQEKCKKNDFSLKDSDFLLLITDLDEQKVKFSNKKLFPFCGVDSIDFLKNEDGAFKNLVHPDDFSDFMVHLNTCKNLPKREVKESFVRLKDQADNWSVYCFKDRIYEWSRQENSHMLLSLVFRVPSQSQEEPEDKYRQLIDSIDEAFCAIEMIFDADGHPFDYLFTETNPAFERLIRLNDPLGKTIRELNPNQEEHWFHTLGKVALSGKPVRFQDRLKIPGNSWIDGKAFELVGKKSRKVGVLFHNSSKPKEAKNTHSRSHPRLRRNLEDRQKEVARNSELLQTVFDTTNLGIALFKAVYDEDGGIKDFLFLRINKVLKHMYLQKDVLGHTYKEISQDGVEMGIFNGLKKVMETGKMLDKEFYLGKKGYNNWFRVTARRQKDLLIASIEDITERKAESEELKEAIRFKRQLVQTSPDTILIINLNDYKVRYINRDMLKRAGMTKKRIKGMALPDILPYLHPRDREKVMEFHRKILKSSDNEIVEIEFRVKTKISTWEWFNARGKVFNRKDKKWVNEYVVLVKNITEQKTTQRALINAERFSIQGEVARTFAHELRNPLASIDMATQVIKTKLRDDLKNPLENYFNILSRSTKLLNELVTDLLNSANYSPAVLKKTDLAAVVDETLNQAADRIYLAGIKVIKNYRGPYFILADKEKLRIALLNIIVNASEATNPDEGIIELVIKEHKTDFVLSITDNGHGLEKEQKERLFDAFYTNKSSGMGVGLSSVKNILEDHDANIEVSSKPKEGTTFQIYFNNINCG